MGIGNQHVHRWQWVSRDRSKDTTFAQVVRKYFGKFTQEFRKLGPVVHAYVCKDCGVKDR